MNHAIMKFSQDTPMVIPCSQSKTDCDMTETKQTRRVPLGDYIEVYDKKNTEGKAYPFYGINKDKTFMPTVADTNQLDNSKYKIVENGTFAFSGMQTGRDVCIRIALFDRDCKVVISPAYTTFKIKDTEKLLPTYLFLLFNREESDRYGWFLSDGSIRSNLDWGRFCDIRIPVPPIEVQKELVAAYNGLRTIAEQNEALVTKLSAACHAYIVDCRAKYPASPLAEFIEESDERNSDLSIKLSQGISNLKEFQEPKQVAQNSTSDKIVRRGYFAYNRATTRNGEKISIAYREGDDCTVSSAYGVFFITDESILNPLFLLLFFKRGEFDRYARWRSEGSAHEFFTFDMMKAVRIPVPPIEVQRAIVEVYDCAERAKKIAAEARERLKTICSALVQRAAHS